MALGESRSLCGLAEQASFVSSQWNSAVWEQNWKPFNSPCEPHLNSTPTWAWINGPVREACGGWQWPWEGKRLRTRGDFPGSSKNVTLEAHVLTIGLLFPPFLHSYGGRMKAILDAGSVCVRENRVCVRVWEGGTSAGPEDQSDLYLLHLTHPQGAPWFHGVPLFPLPLRVGRSPWGQLGERTGVCGIIIIVMCSLGLFSTIPSFMFCSHSFSFSLHMAAVRNPLPQEQSMCTTRGTRDNFRETHRTWYSLIDLVLILLFYYKNNSNENYNL